MKKRNVAIVGAGGMVGRKFIEVLQKRNFPVGQLRLFGSARSAGASLLFSGKEYLIEALTDDSFEGIDIALFSAGAAVSRQSSPIAAAASAIVIDNSSAFRMEENVPLVVPEVNPEAMLSFDGIIANPNCSTIQMVMALKPLHDAAKLKRLVISTYQSVSGMGRSAVDEMQEQVRAFASGERLVAGLFSEQIAFNVLPQIDSFLDDGYTGEEEKMMHETRKIMNLPNLPVTATCVRVPVETGHCISLNVEFETALEPEDARRVLADFPGIVVLDDSATGLYPTPIFSAGKDAVFVGRIRKDASVAFGLNLWIVSDNLLKGAALNTVQIAELVLASG